MVLAVEKHRARRRQRSGRHGGPDRGLPGAANVIPGEVRFTIDVRSGDAARRDRAAEAILDEIQSIAAGAASISASSRSTTFPQPLR
jgi:allantoate deiminase